MVKIRKFKLYGIGNYENFNYYIFDKKQEILKELSKIFDKVFGIYWEFADYTYTKPRKINYEKKQDYHEAMIGKKSRVDIYFGDKKMFVAIYCPHKLRLKFNLELSFITCMPKPKKFKEKW